MPGGKTAARHFIPAVVCESEIALHDQRGAMAYNLPLIFSDELTFRKIVDLPTDLRGRKAFRLAIDLAR